MNCSLCKPRTDCMLENGCYIRKFLSTAMKEMHEAYGAGVDISEMEDNIRAVRVLLDLFQIPDTSVPQLFREEVPMQ
jgi:hypothetical protein